MLGLECTHPDIEEFLMVKQNDTAIQSANLSILFTDEFMNAVEAKEPFELYFKVESTGEVIKKTIDAYGFFRKFCEAQWDYAEPGALYIDTVRSYNLLSGYPESIYKIDICNPCAEYTGSAYNACNLGSINLYNMVNNPFTKEAAFDYIKFGETVELGIITLDQILDYGLENQPLPENKQAVIDWRAIGLGVFGLGDMLIAMGIRYGSEDSIALIDGIMSYMLRVAIASSATIAQCKGTFEKYNWQHIKNSPLMKSLKGTPEYDLVKTFGLRNASLLSIAPTGSIATMTGLSGGVEPLYDISYERTTHSLEKQKKNFKVFAKSVGHLLKFKGIDPENFTDDQIKDGYKFITSAHDIDPIDRIELQATMQKYVDNAISSTVNLNNSATVDDVFDTYLIAWRMGCKGLTIFRDGCARTSILGKTKEEPKKPDEITFDSVKPAKRSNIKKLPGHTIVKSTACVPKMYVTINTKENEIFEVFTAASSGCKSNIGNITRLASLSLRSGVSVKEVINELKENSCPACGVLRQQGNKTVSMSCGSAIAEAIEEVYRELKEPQKDEPVNKLACPSCGEHTLRPEGKCFNCSSCGYSRCD
jgi:ribonucleoside-diphosphate reductase alpha chain